MTTPYIRIRNLRQSFGSQEVLRGIDLDILRGETLVILGASGCGKSVMVKHLPGLMRPTSGEIWIGDQEITHLREREMGPLRHQIGMMFQGGALFDSMTVFDNVAFPLRQESGCSEEEISTRVTRALEIVKLAAHASKFPSDISGGMRKRVALARAVVGMPACIIYDEPHAGLDPMTADTIDRLIKTLQQEHGITNVVITHEIRSVFRIADRVVFMKDGLIYWIGSPADLKLTTDPYLRDFIEGNAQDDS